MIIVYQTETELYDGILALVERGLQFKAVVAALTIHLTGGH